MRVELLQEDNSGNGREGGRERERLCQPTESLALSKDYGIGPLI